MRWPALLFVLVLVLAACGGGGGTATTAAGGETDTTAAAGGETDTTAAGGETATTAEGGAAAPDLAGVELQLMGFSSSTAEDEALNGLIQQFNEETGANASFNPVPEYDTALQAALAGGEPPDLFYVDSNRLPDLASVGALAPVPDGAISNPDDIYPSLREAFTYEGTWYCPPKDFSTLQLVYDPQALEAASVTPPTNWEELIGAAQELTTDDQAGLAMGPEYPRWGVFLFQNGAALTNPEVTEMTLDTPEAREALDVINELYSSGSAVSPTAVDAGWAGEAFGQGKAAMTIEGNWIVNFLADTFPDTEVAYAPLPTGPGGTQGTFAFTVCYGVPANAANPEASWALANYLTDEDGALAWTNAFNVMPARISAADPWLEGHPELEPFLAGAEYASKFQFKPGFGPVLDTFNAQAQALAAGDGSVDQLVEETTAAGDDILGE